MIKAKQFEKKLDKIVELVKQRVRVGEIMYSWKKDAKRLDRRNWIIETEEELADGIAYMIFAYDQFETVYRLLRHAENRLAERIKETRQIERDAEKTADTVG